MLNLLFLEICITSVRDRSNLVTYAAIVCALTSYFIIRGSVDALNYYM